jgi:hypothetical protein
MSKQMRKETVRTLDALDFADLGATNTAVVQLSENLTDAKVRWKTDLIDHKRGALLGQDRCQPRLGKSCIHHHRP